MQRTFNKRILHNSTKLWEKRALVDSPGFSVAWESEMDNYLLSNSLSRRTAQKELLLKMKSALCKWASANQSYSATKHSTSRIVYGYSWNSWTEAHLHPCLRSFKANIPKSSANTVFTRLSKAWLTSIDKTSSIETSSQTTSLSRRMVKSNLPTSVMPLCWLNSSKAARVRSALYAGWLPN